MREREKSRESEESQSVRKKAKLSELEREKKETGRLTDNEKHWPRQPKFNIVHVISNAAKLNSRGIPCFPCLIKRQSK